MSTPKGALLSDKWKTMDRLLTMLKLAYFGIRNQLLNNLANFEKDY